MPLELFQEYEPVAEAIAKDNLKDNEEDDDAVGPHEYVADAPDIPSTVRKICWGLWLFAFIWTGDSPCILISNR